MTYTASLFDASGYCVALCEGDDRAAIEDQAGRLYAGAPLGSTVTLVDDQGTVVREWREGEDRE